MSREYTSQRFIQPSEIQVGDKIKATYQDGGVEFSRTGVVTRVSARTAHASSGWLVWSADEWGTDPTVELLHREIVEPTAFGSMVVLDDGKVYLKYLNGSSPSEWSWVQSDLHGGTTRKWDTIKDRVVSVHAPAVVASSD